MCPGTLVLGAAESNFVAEGATNKNQRVNMRKASSIFACRQGRCCRHLRLGRAALISRGRAAGIYCFPARGTSGRLNAQLPVPIPSSAASACEQAVSRELLLPLTRDTVLAAVPWLRFWRSRDTSPDHPTSNEPIMTDSVEPIMAAMDHDAALGDGSVAFSARLAGHSSAASSCP